MELDVVSRAYARWAPFYDVTFGITAPAARRAAIEHVNRTGRRVLDLGIGTGLSLPLYAPHLQVTGVDYSYEMLARARARAERLGPHIRGLHRMDARRMSFPAESFDTVVALHVLTVVPDPDRVMSEIHRVLTPGGQLVVLGHFGAEGRGAMSLFNRAVGRVAPRLGWDAGFDPAVILDTPGLELAEDRTLPPFGIMRMLVLKTSD